MDAGACPTPVSFREHVGLTVFLTWLFYLTFVSRIIMAPMMPAIEADLGISHAQAGAVFLFIAIGFLMAPAVSGFLNSTFNHRAALSVSNIAVGAALLFFSLLQSFSVSLGAMVVLGLAAGLHIPSAMATITAQIQRSDWGKAIGVHQIAPPLSFVSAPIIVTILGMWLSWRHIVIILGIISILAGIGNQAFNRCGLFPGGRLNFTVAKEVMKTSSFWLMVALFAMAMGGTAGIYSMLPLYLVKDHALSLSLANTVVGTSQITGLVMVFFAGWITDRVGFRKMIAAALSCAGIMTILVGVLSGGWLVAAIFLQPAMVASFFPAAFAAVSRVVRPNLRSVASALATAMAFLVGGGLIPVLIGSLAEAYSFSTGIVIAGCFMLIGPALAGLLKVGQFDNADGC